MKPIIAVPAAILLLGRAISRKSLTPTGVVLAAITVTIHALHPSSVPFTLLGAFFLLGTTATKVKHEVKATLTLSASGDSGDGGKGGGGGGEGPRGAIQVLANSGVASLLCCAHIWMFGYGSGSGSRADILFNNASDQQQQGLAFCFGGVNKIGHNSASNILLIGIVANYAAVTADTLSSELGILSRSLPRLITTGRSVPRGTNGGVTVAGLLAGAGGAAVIGLIAVSLTTFCDVPALTITTAATTAWTWNLKAKAILGSLVTLWGMLGSLLDSWLGAVLQASVIDRRTGKVVEGARGKRVMVVSENKKTQARAQNSTAAAAPKSASRIVGSGRDILDNNQINVLMAAIMSLTGMWVGASALGATFGV